MASRLVVAAIAAISVLGGAALFPREVGAAPMCEWQKSLECGRVMKQRLPSLAPFDTADFDTGETLVMSGRRRPAAKVSIQQGVAVGSGTFEIPAWKTDARLMHTLASQSHAPYPFETRGDWMKPIMGGRRSQGIHDRNAVDLATSCGKAVLAAGEGTIRMAKGGKKPAQKGAPKGASKRAPWNGGYGKYVVIDHPDGTQTLYAHLSRILVVAGQYVEQGFPIGLVGSTGNSTGCHVHFEVRGGKNPF